MGVGLVVVCFGGVWLVFVCVFTCGCVFCCFVLLLVICAWVGWGGCGWCGLGLLDVVV